MIDVRQRTMRLMILLTMFLLYKGSFVYGQETSKTGEVRGKITITKNDEDLQKPPAIDRYSTHHPVATSSPASMTAAPALKLTEKAVVYLETQTVKMPTFAPPTVHPLLDQRDLTFHPQVLPILVGTTVDFPNRDNLFHNVFSYSSPREFDLGRYPTGDSRSVRFDKAGVVRVYCDIHSHMNATILVLENPYFAVPDESGAFVIKNVPSGSYTARLWFGRDLAASQAISVRNGETITVNFTY
jgi:plastocyanin